ncbi:hypothetical protein B0H15DRAFT_563801 [Mycena belliarum]|uniref:F-box domain-containing protein n=1 Tax=Mycena belliarum TaxID=1033014 RepID=A0AAD6TWS8_9AGAR|nr:hypothetical protein B0H15DRAFT_563801 [Mycena belliae]
MAGPPLQSESSLSTSSLLNEHVKGLVDATEANISRIESQIRELSLALQEERRKLAKLWLMATPMGKLPVEILVEIFLHCVDDSEDPSLSTGPIQPGDEPQAAESIAADGPRCPAPQLLLLAQVCPYWRQIVNRTPRLWTVGVVGVRFDRPSCGTEAYISGLKSLLERSAPLPISVSLTQEGDTGTSAGALAQAATTASVIRVLASTIPRWKSLKVDCLSFKPLATLIGGAFPALERLDIQYDTYGRTDPVRAFFPAPRLRRLALLLSGPTLASHAQLLLVPWAQLTHLKLEYASLAGCRAILTQCPSLVCAELLTVEWNLRDAVQAPVTELPRLETLKVRFGMGENDIGDVAPFFAPLALPSLRVLHLTFDAAPGVVWPVQELGAFQNRAPHIEDIALTNCPITSAQLYVLLRLSPAVTALTLKSSTRCVNEEFLGLLTYNGNGEAVLDLAPQLRRLHWEAVGYEFSERALEVALRSRWWTDAQERAVGPSRLRVARLQKVLISRYDMDSVGGGLMHRMQDVVEQGLDLQLFW